MHECMNAGAELVLYGISRAYKESANCRLEAQYAIQQRKDLVPLMMEEGFEAKGCKSSKLTRLATLRMTNMLLDHRSMALLGIIINNNNNNNNNKQGWA